MDGVVGVDAAPGGGADHRLDGGTQVRSPGRAEAAGDLAVDRHRPESALAAVVVRRRVGVLEEGEQAVAHGEVAPAQPLTTAVAWLQGQNPVQLPFQTTAVFPSGAGLERMAATGEHDGPEQERLQPRGKDGVTRLDRIAQVAQLVRQTDLPKVGMAAL